MKPAGKALWYIETKLRDSLTLQDVATASGVSPYHLIRVFSVSMGMPVMRYIRARRLTEAAKELALGARDILSVAIDAGYGSHEAFTRAFRDRFGITPETVRAQGHTTGLNLLDAIKMEECPMNTIQSPRIEDGRLMLIAGLSESYTPQTSSGIPAQWQRFGPYIGTLPNQVGRATYGVCRNEDGDGNVDYLCGIEVKNFDDLPAEFTHVKITPRTYAVFSHKDHISTIRSTWHTIFAAWFPSSDYQVDNAPEFERYDEAFDPETGHGGLEIWIPIIKK